MMTIKNDNGEYWCGRTFGKNIWLNSYTLAYKFANGAEARKMLNYLKDKTNNHQLKIENE